jgi:hypothetical protein
VIVLDKKKQDDCAAELGAAVVKLLHPQLYLFFFRNPWTSPRRISGRLKRFNEGSVCLCVCVCANWKLNENPANDTHPAIFFSQFSMESSNVNERCCLDIDRISFIQIFFTNSLRKRQRQPSCSRIPRSNAIGCGAATNENVWGISSTVCASRYRLPEPLAFF